MQINEQDFLSFLKIKEGLDDTTVRHCRSRIRIINKWLASNELSKQSVERYFSYLKEEKGLKNNTLNTYRFVFRHLALYCKDRGMVDDFYDGFKSYKKGKPHIEILTLDEIDGLVATSLPYGRLYGKDTSFLDFRYRTFTWFLSQTGCRYSEASNLKIRYLDLSAGKAYFIDTKTDENRTNYFTKSLGEHLKLLIENQPQDGFVFRNALESQINASDYSIDLKKRAVTAGITKNVHPHIFRHSYITHMLEAGLPIERVSKLVGHKDIRTTMGYLHLCDRTLQRTAMMHPSLRQNLEPEEVFRDIRENLDLIRRLLDDRFNISMAETDGSINFRVALK